MKETNRPAPRKIAGSKATATTTTSRASSKQANSPSYIEEQQLIEDIMQLYVEEAEMTVVEILDELSEKWHDQEHISRWAFLDDCLRTIGLLPSIEDEKKAKRLRAAYATLAWPDQLLLHYPELESLRPAAHANITIG